MTIPILPQELWEEIAEQVHHRPTLRALALTSHYLHAIVQPILYRLVSLRPSTANANQLGAFMMSINVANSRRRSMVKHLAICFLLDKVRSEEFEGILPRLPNLESLLIRRHHGRRIPPNHFEQSLYHPSIAQWSLRRLAWIRIPISQPDRFRSFILSQNNLEHLDLDTSFTLPLLKHDDLPRLRVFGGNLKSVFRILPGRKINKIRTDYFAGSNELIPHGFSDNDACVFSCDSTYGWGVSRLISCFKNIEFLEFHRANGSWLYDLPDQLPSNRIRFIRFAHDRSCRAHRFVKHLFDHMPLLECVEVQRVVGGFRPPPVQREYSERWYRGREMQLIKVDWDCPMDEEWWHDWEKDVRAIE